MKNCLLPLLIALLTAPAALAQGRPFEHEDYLTYFSPGRFASKSDYYSSTGEMSVISNRPSSILGRQFLAQGIEAIDAAPNYDLGSVFPYYKVQSRTVEHMVWDASRKLWLFDYSEAEFDSDRSVAWESHNTDPEISPGDRKVGDMHGFYKDADTRAKRDVSAIEAEYRRNVIGTWTWRCEYLRGEDYEVRCVATHMPTMRPEDYSYRRLDQIS
jgi:hypothetical protein